MHRDDSILDKLADFENPNEAMQAFHYHGTVEDFIGAPKVGGDGLFWCADNPAVAQCYIPAAGGEIFLSMLSYQMNDRVRPDKNSGWLEIVKMMGFTDLKVQWNAFGEAQSWSIPQGYPTYKQACDWLESELGYPNIARYEHERCYRIKTATKSKTEDIYLPADYKKAGKLFIVEGIQNLRMLDFATGREGDLSNPDHLRFDVFQKAADQGYDGIIIQDFAQSQTHGNVGHVSWGVFKHALERLSFTSIPAVRFDWDEDKSCSELITPEFEAAWNLERQKHRTLTF